MLTASLLVWLQIGCSPTPPPAGQLPAAQEGGDIEPLEARHRPRHTHPHRGLPGGDRGTAHHALPAGVPAKVGAVLSHIDKTHKAPAGYEGGRTFHNSGQGGEQRLPQKDKEGDVVSYHEWDVNPHVKDVNRGAERLVTGSDGSAYYTRDHYKTFTKVR